MTKVESRGDPTRKRHSRHRRRRRRPRERRRTTIGRWARGLALSYIVVLVTAVPLVGAAATYYVLDAYKLTPRQLAVKVMERLNIDSPFLVSLVSPTPSYAEHELDGRIRPHHPRILLPELANWSGIGRPPYMAARDQEYLDRQIDPLGPACPSGGVLQKATCWVVTGDLAVGEAAVAELRRFRIETPDVVGQYGNAWIPAFAYDLLSTHPQMTSSVRVEIEAKLAKGLADLLLVLDDPSPSLWHGRSTLAANAWLTAVVLTPGNEGRDAMVARAQRHFLETIRALARTEAWPEGYNYWIQQRGLLIALASAAYVNGLVDAENTELIKELMKRVGLWHIYATRPDNRIERIGDAGSRIDLKDETRRVIDILAQITRDPMLSGFSRYLARLHGRESYYRGYRWAFRLFNDPTVPPWPGMENGSLEPLGWALPKAALFGRGAFNQGYIRTGWGPDDTFISYRAGHIFTHHGHYDAGHFTIFKGAPLAINSSADGPYTGPHRLNYSIRTVAKNSLLILRPGETVQPNHFFEENVADGGQRVVLPTGSAIRSLAHWRENLDDGLHLRAGDLAGYEAESGSHVYFSADITPAYNNTEFDTNGDGGKVEKVVRTFFYLFDEDVLLVSDEVVLTDPTFTPKWLLHTVEKPRVEGAVVLRGSRDDGILQTSSPSALIQNGRGYLRVERLLPAEGVTRLVGGPGHRYYVEADGDDSTLDGRNFSAGASDKPWNDPGMWRLEIQPQRQQVSHRFVVALFPTLDEPSDDLIARVGVPAELATAVAINNTLIVFARSEKGEITLPLPDPDTKLYLVGLPGYAEVSISKGGEAERHRASGEGVFHLGLDDGSSEVRIGW